MKRLLGIASLMLLGLAPASAHGQSSTQCQFILGFQTLHNLAPAVIGDCLDNQTYAANGNAQEDTTKGLMVWRKADNWTAFTNGYMTWINGPNGLVSRLNTDRFPWEAPDATPPASASPAPSAPTAIAVTLTDSGFSPGSVTIPAGGTVTWSNIGTQYHSVQSLLTAPLQFNTGAIPNNNSGSFTFFQPGAYSYSAGTDCLLPQGGIIATFSCGVPYTVTVTGQPAQPAAGGQTVTIDDTFGFSPNAVSIRSGQTVTWVNKMTNTATHSVVVNSGAGLILDSGGISPGKSFSYSFGGPALVGYHSSTEPFYAQPVGLSTPVQYYKFVGTVSVSS